MYTVSPSTPSVNAEWSFPVQMKKLPSFWDFDVVPASRVTGVLTSYKLSFISGHEMITNQKVLVDLTPDIWYGDGTATASVTCTGDGKVLTKVECSVEKVCLTDLTDPNAKQIQSGRFTATLTFQGNLIPEGTPFWFTISSLKNAPFTGRPITVKSLQVLDHPDLAVIQEYSVKPFPTIVMNQPAEIIEKAITLELQTVDKVTSMQVTFKTVNRMPSSAIVVIGYPTGAEFP